MVSPPSPPLASAWAMLDPPMAVALMAPVPVATTVLLALPPAPAGGGGVAAVAALAAADRHVDRVGGAAARAGGGVGVGVGSGVGGGVAAAVGGGVAGAARVAGAPRGDGARRRRWSGRGCPSCDCWSRSFRCHRFRCPTTNRCRLMETSPCWRTLRRWNRCCHCWRRSPRSPTNCFLLLDFLLRWRFRRSRRSTFRIPCSFLQRQCRSRRRHRWRGRGCWHCLQCHLDGHRPLRSRWHIGPCRWRRRGRLRCHRRGHQPRSSRRCHRLRCRSSWRRRGTLRWRRR